MKNLQYAFIAIVLLYNQQLFSQELITDSSMQSKRINLNEVIISVNKIEEIKRNVAQQIQILSATQIANSQSQSTADLLANTGTLSVQKSQLGGGSPTIRGFEANRILLVIDGVRMNNLIYRAGHLQNIVTLDKSVLDRVEILFGPASTIYGSDALGGVIHLYSKRPAFSIDNKEYNIKANAFVRYGSVDNELAGHTDFNIGGKKVASLTSISYSKFDDLSGGKSKNPFYKTSYGERPFYVERINGKDSLVKNKNNFLQIQSGYSQYDFMQKFSFKQNDNVVHNLNFQYSNSSDVPRYDRLTDPSGNGLKYAEWYYGPQKRLLTAYDLNVSMPISFFQKLHAGISYQNIEESRNTRRFGKNNLQHRIEKVNVMGANLDLQRNSGNHSIRIGLDAQYNTLKSTANEENIETGLKSKLDTRYPDGDNTMTSVAAYLSHTWKISDHLTFIDGIRFGMINLHSTFEDISFFDLPYTKADQNNFVYSGSVGLINTCKDDLKLSLLLSTGFRAPNVDDLSKIFESAPGTVIVPNPDLKPEKTINSEIGITKIFNGKTSWENTVFYTRFIDAIVTDKFIFNGQDSILYDGTISGVFANQNKQKSYLYGFSSNLRSQVSDKIELLVGMNYTYGRIKTDSSDYPLDHIPPFMLHLQLSYSFDKFSSDLIINYNGWKRLKNYYLNGEDNEQYATPEGMPAWFTLNLRASYKVHKLITIQAGIDNIMDTQYRTFASGINAPGRNIFAAVRFYY